MRKVWHENAKPTKPTTVRSSALAQADEEGRRGAVKTHSHKNLFRSAGVRGPGEKAAGPGELARTNRGRHPAGPASPQAREDVTPGYASATSAGQGRGFK